MATPKKFDWGDGNGAIHSMSKADAQAQAKAKAKANTTVATPALGSYDPNLDAQQHAEQRAFDNSTADTTTQSQDLDFDLGIATNAAGVQKGRNDQDYASGQQAINTSSGRSLADLLQNRARTGEDYQTTLSDLTRNYQRLGDSQNQAINKAGAEATGGAYAQSARKRAENQAHDKSPIDLAYQRSMTDSGIAQTRLGEDTKTSLDDLLRGYTRGGEDIDASLGQTGLNYTRQTRDLGTASDRAGDEHSAFTQDIKTARQISSGAVPITSAGTPITSPTAVGAPTAAVTKPKKKKPRVITYTSGVNTP